ncbi:NAD-dependent epimerase/dehydratase family protein [Candidatus Dojkabacteria bacterium]|nr:NAD-dependent epimerase/dehydratase family protein [Candidatus Dojkabacteria bacterium]
MPILEKLTKHKNAPVTLIFKGANVLGIEVAKLLIEQGAFVVLIDEYTQQKKNMASSVLNEELFSFVDISGISSLVETVEHVDYIFFLNHENYDSKENISTSEFLDKSNTLDRLLQLATEKKSKFLLTSSIKLHQIIQGKKDVVSDFDLDDDSLSYTNLEVQRYAENLTWEYYKRGGLNARIVRIGEILGEGIDFNKDALVVRYIKDAISGQKLSVEGDGLENLYFVHVLDAAYGLIKAQFTEKTSGQVYSLVIPRDITILNLAYKILDLEPRAGGIDFIDQKEKDELHVYKPAKNLKSIGWKPKVSFERALASTIDYAYKVLGKKKAPVQETQARVQPPVPPKQDIKKDEEGKEKKKRKSLKDFFVNFFFEVKEEKKARSVLDSVQYKPTQKPQTEKPEKGKIAERVSLSQKKEIRKAEPKSNKLKSFALKFTGLFSNLRNTVRTFTLAQFFGYFTAAIIVLLLYFAFFVPVSKIVYKGSVAFLYTNSAAKAMGNWQFSKASSDLESANLALTEVNSNLDKLSFLASIKQFDSLGRLQNKVSESSRVLTAAQMLTESAGPFESYLNEYQSNVLLDGKEDLKVQPGNIYELDGLLDVDVARWGQMLEGADTVFDESEFNLTLIGGRIKGFQEALTSIKQTSDVTLDLVSVMPTLLGVEDEQTFAVLLVNEEKMNTRGGEIEAVCVFSYFKGQLSNTRIYGSSDINLKLTSQQERFVRNDLKALYPEDGLTFRELTIIFDDGTFESLIKSSIETIYEESPDHIVTLNFEALGDLISLIGGVELEGLGIVNSSNYEESIQKSDISYRELMAKIFERVFQYKKEDLLAFGTLIGNHIKSSNMVLYSQSSILDKFLADKGITKTPPMDSYDWFSVHAVTDSQNMPSIKVETRIELKDADSEAEHKLSFEKNIEGDFLGTVILEFGPDFDISEITTSSDKVQVLQEYRNKVFLQLNLVKDDKENAVVKGKSTGVVIQKENEYNYFLQLEKPAGFFYYYDILLDYGKDYQLMSVSPESVTVDSAVKILGSINEDMLWRLNLSQP